MILELDSDESRKPPPPSPQRENPWQIQEDPGYKESSLIAFESSLKHRNAEPAINN